MTNNIVLTELDIKALVRARDGHSCTECGMTDEEHRKRYAKTLDVHRLIPGSEYTIDGCVTLCKKCHGGQPTRKGPKRNDVSVALDAEVYRMARIIAAYEDVPIAELLSETVRPIFIKKLEHHQKQKPKAD